MNKIKLTITATFLTLFSCSPAIAQSGEPEVIGDGDRISVLCTQTSPKKLLIRNPESGQWCDSELVNFCRNDKDMAAKNICGRRYKIAKRKLDKGDIETSVISENVSEKIEKPLAKQESGSDFNADIQSQKRRYELELELLQIQEERLEVKKRLIEIQKKESDLDLQKNEIN